MKSIRKRLQSRTGASIIIAMAFFLIAFFVGSTVLAAATANGGRLKDMKAHRQEFLKERSAALLLKEQLQSAPQLTITNTETTVTDYTTQPTQVNVTTSVEINGTYDAGCNDLQKVMYQAVMNQSVKEYKKNLGGAESMMTVKLQGIDSSTDAMYPEKGKIAVNVNGEPIDGEYSCSVNEKNGKVIAFQVKFSQVTLWVSVNATTGSKVLTSEGNTRHTAQEVNFYWSEPVIVKGGSNEKGHE